MDSQNWLNRISRMMMTTGLVFLAAAMLLAAVAAPVRAQEDTPPEVTAESTATAEPTEQPTEETFASESSDLYVVCVQTMEDGALLALLSDGSQRAVVDGWVEGTALAVDENTTVCEVVEEPAEMQAVSSARYAVNGSAEVMCAAIPYDIHADFVVTVSGLPEGYEGLELFVLDPYGNVTSYPVSSTGGTVTVMDTWPGINHLFSPLWMEWRAYLYDQGSQVADGIALVTYDPNLGDLQTCTKALLLAQPSCDPEGSKQLVWSAYNPNPWTAEYEWYVDGILAGKGLLQPKGSGELTAQYLGLSSMGAHTAELVWVGVEGKGALLTMSEGVYCSDETSPQPPEQPLVPAAAVQPAYQAPVEEGAALLIPVTGADMSAPLISTGFFTNLYTCVGLFFLGIGLVLQGVRTRLTK